MASGLVPDANAEALLIGSALAAPSETAVAIVLLKAADRSERAADTAERPPLDVMAIGAGITRLPIPTLVALCFVGRFLRFYTLADISGLL